MMETQTTTEAPEYVPGHLEEWRPGSGAGSWDSAANYVGTSFRGCYLAPIHRTRDTQDSVTLSNWEVVSAELDALVTHEDSGAVTIGHWACGWFEMYLVHASDTAALRCADEWAASLADYPVASEDALSEWECEHEEEEWIGWAEREWRDMVTKVLDEYAPDDASPYWGEELLEAKGIDDDRLRSLFYDLSQHIGWVTQWGSEGCIFNLEGAAENLSAEALSELLGLALVASDQQWRYEPYPWPGAEPSPLLLPPTVT